MKRSGVIEPLSSPWSSPVVLIKKKDDSTRFYLDYRKLNNVPLKYPPPKIDVTFDTLAGTKVVNGTERLVGYYSRTLSKLEWNYCVKHVSN